MLAEWIRWDKVDDMSLDDIDLLNLMLDVREDARRSSSSSEVVVP